MQEALLSFDLHYAENANCTRETETSNSCIDAVYSNVKIDLKVSQNTLTDHYTLFFGFSGHKLNHSEKENDDDRMIKMWTKLNDSNVIINLQFYMQNELQKIELTFDQLSSEEAVNLLKNLFLQKFVKVQKVKKLWIDNEIKHLATKKRQQNQNFMRTKEKNDLLKFNALRNKLQKLIRRKKEMYYQRLMNADGQKNSKFLFWLH